MFQGLIDLYKPFNLDWIIVRQFSWHPIAIILSTMLQNSTLATLAQAGNFLQYVDQTMSNRAFEDFFAGNKTLWEPLDRMREQIRNLQANDAQSNTATSSQVMNVDWSAFGLE